MTRGVFRIALFAGLTLLIQTARAESLPESTPLNNLGEAVVHIKKDILILSNSTRVAFKKGAIVPKYAERDLPMCSIELRDAARKTRILRAGARDIQLTGEIGNNVCREGGCWIQLMVSPTDQTVSGILCANPMDNGQEISLKTLLVAFGPYVTVETAQPGHGLNEPHQN